MNNETGIKADKYQLLSVKLTSFSPLTDIHPLSEFYKKNILRCQVITWPANVRVKLWFVYSLSRWYQGFGLYHMERQPISNDVIKIVSYGKYRMHSAPTTFSFTSIVLSWVNNWDNHLDTRILWCMWWPWPHFYQTGSA